MKNISFDNPLFLLIALPLLAAVILPFAIAIRKDNRSKSVVGSLILHLLIVLCVTLGVAGTVYTTVMTETQVFVVADVSHSAKANADTLDAYIADVQKALPHNAKLGVVAFGRSAELLTPMGDSLRSVKEATVDASATDIVPALEYAVSLFDEGVIRRIVLITDGRQTDPAATGRLISAVESLYARDIYIDAVYLDSNIKEDVGEVQISDVDFTASTYLHHEATADILVQSNRDTKAILSLYRGENKIKDEAVSLSRGFNVINIPMDTSVTGSFDYRAEIRAEQDASPHNNAYSFTQTVADGVKVLFVGEREADLATARRVFGERAQIDAYIGDKNVPYRLEELCAYDEIVLSNVDVRNLENFTVFVENIEKCVSIFGKSLVTVGDIKIQNSTDKVLSMLEDMLPVRFGNNDQDPKLYTLVIDTSRSMNDSYQLSMMKQAAVQILKLLSDHDYVAVISFSGEVSVVQPPVAAVNRDRIISLINSIEPTQGTFIGAAMEKAYEHMKDLPFSEKQIMLISDGLSYTAEEDNPVQIAADMLQNGIMTGTVNTASQEGAEMLEAIAAAGGGSYYYLARVENVADLVLGEMANDITGSVIEGDTVVLVEKGADAVMEGLSTLPNVGGYLYSSAKTGATVPLAVSYRKAGGGHVVAPLYVYWEYGNGRVAGFTSDMGEGWVSDWANETGDRFFRNLFETNIPAEKLDCPYTVGIGYDGVSASLSVIPSLVDPFAPMSLEVLLPNGEKLTDSLLFNTDGYYYSFAPESLGKYAVSLSYTVDGETYSSLTHFHLCYSPEYDSFVSFDKASLEEVIRNRGRVFEKGADVELINDPNKIATYELDFTVPLLIAAVALFVLDVIVRKVTLNDIRSLFKKRAAGK